MRFSHLLMAYKSQTLVGKDKQQRVLVKQKLIALIVHVVDGSSPSQVMNNIFCFVLYLARVTAEMSCDVHRH